MRGGRRDGLNTLTWHWQILVSLPGVRRERGSVVGGVPKGFIDFFLHTRAGRWIGRSHTNTHGASYSLLPLIYYLHGYRGRGCSWLLSVLVSSWPRGSRSLLTGRRGGSEERRDGDGLGRVGVSTQACAALLTPARSCSHNKSRGPPWRGRLSPGWPLSAHRALTLFTRPPVTNSSQSYL